VVLLICTYIFNKLYIITVSKYILYISMMGCSILLQLQTWCCKEIHTIFFAFNLVFGILKNVSN